jgi:hypothetical protein
MNSGCAPVIFLLWLCMLVAGALLASKNIIGVILVAPKADKCYVTAS